MNGSKIIFKQFAVRIFVCMIFRIWWHYSRFIKGLATYGILQIAVVFNKAAKRKNIGKLKCLLQCQICSKEQHNTVRINA